MGGFTRRPKVTPKVAEAFTDLADNSNVKLSPEDTPGTQAYSDAKEKLAVSAHCWAAVGHQEPLKRKQN